MHNRYSIPPHLPPNTLLALNTQPPHNVMEQYKTYNNTLRKNIWVPLSPLPYTLPHTNKWFSNIDIHHKRANLLWDAL